MKNSAARIVIGILVAVTGIYSGLLLAMYAEADDAPGGVLLGIIFMLGSLALGSWIALRREQKASANGG